MGIMTGVILIFIFKECSTFWFIKKYLKIFQRVKFVMIEYVGFKHIRILIWIWILEYSFIFIWIWMNIQTAEYYRCCIFFTCTSFICFENFHPIIGVRPLFASCEFYISFFCYFLDLGCQFDIHLQAYNHCAFDCALCIIIIIIMHCALCIWLCIMHCALCIWLKVLSEDQMSI